MIRLFVRWLELLGVTADRLRYPRQHSRVRRHRGAEAYWAEVVGVDASAFSKTTIKKHNPRTVRKNVGETYHGCLVIYVRQSAELYRRMEGAWYGIVLGAGRAT